MKRRFEEAPLLGAEFPLTFPHATSYMSSSSGIQHDDLPVPTYPYIQ